MGTYRGPDTTRPFAGPPLGEHLAFAFGRMFISMGRVLVWSELHRLDLFDEEQSMVQFNSRIRMLKAVEGGLFVSTDLNTYFLTGKNPNRFAPVHVAEFPAVEWSAAGKLVEGPEIGLKFPGLCAVWASPEGVILGLPSGQVYNRTKRRVVYPNNVTAGYGCLRGYNYIHGME
jgi:hypothetical protein